MPLKLWAVNKAAYSRLSVSSVLVATVASGSPSDTSASALRHVRTIHSCSSSSVGGILHEVIALFQTFDLRSHTHTHTRGGEGRGGGYEEELHSSRCSAVKRPKRAGAPPPPTPRIIKPAGHLRSVRLRRSSAIQAPGSNVRQIKIRLTIREKITSQRHFRRR